MTFAVSRSSNGASSKYFMAFPSSDSSRWPVTMPAFSKPVQVHVQQRRGDPEPAGQLADVHPPLGQLGDDPQPQRDGHGRELSEQLFLSGERLGLMGQRRLLDLLARTYMCTCKLELTHDGSDLSKAFAAPQVPDVLSQPA